MDLKDLEKANELSNKLAVIRGAIDTWAKQSPHGPSSIGYGIGGVVSDVQVVDHTAWLAMRAASVKLLEEQYDRAAAKLASM